MGIKELAASVPELDREAEAAARKRLDSLTKPRGSLGRLEDLAASLAAMTARERPRFRHKVVIVAAGDHGVAEAGVSAYPQEVTPQMVANFLRGGAAINALAKVAGARVVVVDAGVKGEAASTEGLLVRKLGPGTANIARGPAMTRAKAEEGVLSGASVALDECDKGMDLLAVGDMGIANTTPSSAIVACLTGEPAGKVTGRGTGVDDEALRAKARVVERALEVNRPGASDALDVLSKVGGFEIAFLAGAMLGAASKRVPVVLDGFITTAAALVANGLCPRLKGFLTASHVSAERGHLIALDFLGLKALLKLGMRLGEGSGAAVAMLLVEAATAALDDMATFEEAGVSE